LCGLNSLHVRDAIASRWLWVICGTCESGLPDADPALLWRFDETMIWTLTDLTGLSSFRRAVRVARGHIAIVLPWQLVLIRPAAGSRFGRGCGVGSRVYLTPHAAAGWPAPPGCSLQVRSTRSTACSRCWSGWHSWRWDVDLAQPSAICCRFPSMLMRFVAYHPPRDVSPSHTFIVRLVSLSAWLVAALSDQRQLDPPRHRCARLGLDRARGLAADYVAVDQARRSAGAARGCRISSPQ